MIPSKDSTAETMLHTLAYTIAALDAAADLNVDRSEADRALLVAEKSPLEDIKGKLSTANQTLRIHMDETLRLQVRVEIANRAINYGMSAGKEQMKVGLKNQPGNGADFVFGANIQVITDADLRSKPGLLLQLVSRFVHVSEFPGKDQLRSDLEARATRQQQALAERDNGEQTRVMLSDIVAQLVKEASDALYRSEKRLLEHFVRERKYVSQFFPNTRAPKKSKAKKQTPETPEKSA